MEFISYIIITQKAYSIISIIEKDTVNLFKGKNVFSWIYTFVDRLLCCQYLYSYNANDLSKAIDYKLSKNTLQPE
jgi:hypothetical protein